MYITRLASNEIFLPSNKIHREVGRAKDLSAPLYLQCQVLESVELSLPPPPHMAACHSAYRPPVQSSEMLWKKISNLGQNEQNN